ncbi:sperm-associated antigen 1 [Chanos chanos]|uniref:Sperm-associated antigen 1 n=1 Tax=Chanos chanos TaxID=29144 RepID=A0A6J2W0W5_CHACN|nr:sperm-associated antigen 1 [Chanos chanos]
MSCLSGQERGTNKVPVEHLDYSFIEKCTDVRYLEKILRILRSGEEGIFPHLIEYCEKHIRKLDPKSRALRKEKPPATAASFTKEEWSQITDELKTWEEEIKVNEVKIKQTPLLCNEENVPPVRGSHCSIQVKSYSIGANKTKKNAAPPRDYRDWDKFDVEKECAKIDGDITENEPAVIINHGLPKIRRKMDTAALTEQEKIQLADREKDKGNEAFRSNDYQEAVAYYTRSLSVLPTVAAYNNRAQAEIKLQHWHSALADCQKVLEMEPGNLKALLRRATVNKNLGDLQIACDDVKTVLCSEPQNMIAKRLLEELNTLMRKNTHGVASKGKKISIQEVEEECEELEQELPSHKQAKGFSQRVGGDSSRSTAPKERGDMGNTHKKSHGRNEGVGGGGSPHAEPQHAWRGKGGKNANKYKVQPNGEAPDSDRDKDKLSNGNCRGQPNDSKKTEQAEEKVNLDAPAGALPPPLARLKNEGNQLFKNGQFADALEKYSQAITGFTEAGIDSPEDLSILYSNRAACYLKDGNSTDCITDCTRALELQPFSLKPLLRRAMAYESLERYQKAYVDYKTVLQIDMSVQAAHDSINRITRLLIEQNGPEWREKLPEIPVVPLSAQRHRVEAPPTAEEAQARAERAAQEAAKRAEAQFTVLKMEGNDFVKKGQYQEALGKYSKCLTLKPDECAIYTNRALCYVKLERFSEAKQDCDSALRLEPSNKKAFYRRALANKGLKNYVACSSDLKEVLQLDPTVQEAERELEEVTMLLKNSQDSPDKPRRNVPITEVEEGDEEETQAPSRGPEEVKENSPGSQNHCSDGPDANAQPTNAYDFGQALNAACSRGDVAACTELLRSTSPEKLPLYICSHLDGHTLSFIIKVLDTHLMETDPKLVYQHLSHLHTADRFSVVLMLLDDNERLQMTQLFEHLSAVECEDFSNTDIQNLASKYIRASV